MWLHNILMTIMVSFTFGEVEVVLGNVGTMPVQGKPQVRWGHVVVHTSI